jgi:hypothetical protein
LSGGAVGESAEAGLHVHAHSNALNYLSPTLSPGGVGRAGAGESPKAVPSGSRNPHAEPAARPSRRRRAARIGPVRLLFGKVESCSQSQEHHKNGDPPHCRANIVRLVDRPTRMCDIAGREVPRPQVLQYAQGHNRSVGTHCSGRGCAAFWTGGSFPRQLPGVRRPNAN